MLSLMEAGSVSLVLAMVATPLLMSFLRHRQMGQRIHADVTQHAAKEGTPTMGGIAFIGAATIGYLMGHVGTAIHFTRAGVTVMTVTVLAAILGFIDDYVSIRSARNRGLNKRAKFIGQVILAVAFAWASVSWVHTATTFSFTRSDFPGWQLGGLGWSMFAVFALVATSNAVNFTDGLDGLVAGSATMAFGVLAIIGYWQFRHTFIQDLYHLPAALDLGLVAVSLVGGCLGFLWFNAAPARIMMGDTGSLALGFALAGLCLLMKLDALLAVLGGVYVLEGISVVLQIFSFRVFHRRIFKMAPIHHHFELKGWPETTVIIRFWIIAALLAALGLGMFYGDFFHLAKGV
jgi:phospho-N-acetylmuramoyl-pentapeptide-transferase